MTKMFDLSLYDYELPKGLIAQYPYERRDKARLMIVSDKIEHKVFSNLIDYVSSGDVIVLNQTKVLKFKLYAQKITGANAEITIMNTNLVDVSRTKILCKIKGSKPKIGNEYEIEDIKAKIISADEDDFVLEFYSGDNVLTMMELKEFCDKHGYYPLPGYIKEQSKDYDYQEKYQAVFAEKEGSIAAPTASLHFTPELIDKLKQKGVKFAYLTLHVSYSTFKSINVSDIREHKLDPEFIEIDSENATLINNAKGEVIAVGTTVLKSLESLSDINGFISPKSMLSELYIYPSYKFKSKATKLLTNFHLPKSSLILLTSAFASWQRVKEAYELGVKEKYKFFSFGDAMLLDKNEII